LVVEKWLAKPEKQEEHTQVMHKFRKYIKDNPEMFKEVKSIREYTQMLGGISGMFIWLIEYDSLADYAKLTSRMGKDEEAAELTQEWTALIDRPTWSVEIWRATE